MIEGPLIMMQTFLLELYGRTLCTLRLYLYNFKISEYFSIKNKKNNFFLNYLWKNSGLSINFDCSFPNHLFGPGLKFLIKEVILHWKSRSHWILSLYRIFRNIEVRIIETPLYTWKILWFLSVVSQRSLISPRNSWKNSH